jgi:hypothetical protein
MMSLNEIREEDRMESCNREKLTSRFLESAMRIAGVAERNDVDHECAYE